MGRESQSIAFYKTPGMEWLYSGVTIRTSSALRMPFLSSTTDEGGHCSSS
jgi:hypothetical protein